MTLQELCAARPVCGTTDRRPGDPAANDLIARLRETAGRMVPFSQHKILLRAAALAIEQLETDVRTRAAEVVRLTTELKALRATLPGS